MDFEVVVSIFAPPGINAGGGVTKEYLDLAGHQKVDEGQLELAL